MFLISILIQIEKVTQAKVQIERAENGTVIRKVVLRGRVDQVSHAAHLIFLRVWDAMSTENMREPSTLERTELLVSNQIVVSSIQ